VPYSPPLESEYKINPDKILAGLRRTMQPKRPR